MKALIGGGADPNIEDRVSGSDCSTAGLCSNVLLLQLLQCVSEHMLYKLLYKIQFFIYYIMSFHMHTIFCCCSRSVCVCVLVIMFVCMHASLCVCLCVFMFVSILYTCTSVCMCM